MVKKLAILLVLVMLVAAIAGCSQTQKRAFSRNVKYLGDDTIRFVGLDAPSGLHARDLEAWDAYEPYRGYR